MNRKQVTMYDFEVAKDKVLMGAERKSMLLTERRAGNAYHEAGHALVSLMREHSDRFTRSPSFPAHGSGRHHIFARRPAQLQREYLEANLAIAYGGRVAEKSSSIRCPPARAAILKAPPTWLAAWSAHTA